MQSRKEASGTPNGEALELSRFSENVLAMLHVRGSDALPAWLAERVGALLPQTRRRVLRVYPGTAARIKDPPGLEAFAVADPARPEPPGAIDVDAVLLEALRAKRVLTIAAGEGGARVLVALGPARGVRYLIEVFGEEPATQVEAALRAFVAIAAKYFERLVEAETDPLTRLSNRRAFQAHVDAGMRGWIASGRAYYFAMLDIDHFKRVNDSFGHLYGDEILVHFANLMRRTFRAGDLLYRFGGEEFVLVYGADSGAAGEEPLERFRMAVEKYSFPGIGKVTVSAGFTRIADSSTPAATLIDRADRAVYHAKANGRNRVCSFDALVAAGELEAGMGARKDVILF